MNAGEPAEPGQPAPPAGCESVSGTPPAVGQYRRSPGNHM